LPYKYQQNITWWRWLFLGVKYVHHSIQSSGQISLHACPHPPPDPDRLKLYAQSALNHTREWILTYGARLAGTAACEHAARAICAGLQAACGKASLEPFTTHPAAFYKFYQIDAVLYLAGLALLLAGQPLAAGALLLFMVTTAGLEFGWYVEFYDRLYPRQTCHNVTAVLEPRDDARQQLIFSGHHDSALELKFLRRRQKLYALKIVIPDAIRIFGLVTAWAWVIVRLAAGGEPAFVLPAKILLVLGIYPVFTKFFLFGSQATPGAGDNLIASAMLLELAARFSDPKQSGRSILDHTRLVFVSFDAEESGLRGSRAWSRAHAAEIRSLPTFALNIDSIYRVGDLALLLSDLNSHVHLDGDLAARCIRIANERGYPAAPAVMRFGGGATDATELTRAGARATTLIAMPAGVVRDGLVYHTLQDTVDAIEPSAVEACLAVAEGLAIELDSPPQDPPPG
jgi:aminopeptidase YwaD